LNKDEAFVNDFKQVTSTCAMNILDPSQYPSPILDYSAELPPEMTPEKLLVVYGTLWAL